MDNGVILQGFEWYLSNDGNYYKVMKNRACELAKAGITAIWIPPCTKGHAGNSDVGYGIYDLFDLGEFNQKGSIRTKYGTKEELIEMINEFHKYYIDVYADVVLNHKAGADKEEIFKATKVDSENRTVEISPEKDIKAWTYFDFPNREGKYSKFIWNYTHFNGVDYDSLSNESGIYRISGENKGWSWAVEGEKGNFDYLMFANIDHSNQEVKQELFDYARWFIKTTRVDGFRLDAVKHIDAEFMRELASVVEQEYGSRFYILGEYWKGEIDSNESYIEKTDRLIDLFDVKLHYNLVEASKSNGTFDLRTIFDNTLVKSDSTKAVTFVDNHDTQPYQALNSWVEDWFKEIAYGLILLRPYGYPCVFYGDYYGIKMQKPDGSGEFVYKGLKDKIDIMLDLRKNHCFGEIEDYFVSENVIGWLFKGDNEHNEKTAIIITDNTEQSISMNLGIEFKGFKYVDALKNNDSTCIVDKNGICEFKVNAGSISVYCQE